MALVIYLLWDFTRNQSAGLQATLGHSLLERIVFILCKPDLVSRDIGVSRWYDDVWIWVCQKWGIAHSKLPIWIGRMRRVHGNCEHHISKQSNKIHNHSFHLSMPSAWTPVSRVSSVPTAWWFSAPPPWWPQWYHHLPTQSWHLSAGPANQHANVGSDHKNVVIMPQLTPWASRANGWPCLQSDLQETLF